MIKTKHNLFRRTLAVLLVVVSLLQWIPTSAIADVIDAITADSSTYTPGDVNGDGSVNALDVNLIRRYIAGGYGVEINTLAADVDADGYITEKDVPTSVAIL